MYEEWHTPEDLNRQIRSTHYSRVLSIMEPDGVDRRIDLAWLKDQVVDTCLRAASQVNSADLRAASVRVPGVAKNARDPDIVDDELTCLQFVPSSDQSAESTLTLVIFPCHPEVLWEGNQRISSDYPGYLREAIEMATGGECLFFAGALGGMMTPDVKEHSFEEAAHMGEVLARNALQALSGAQTGEELVSFRRAEFPIPMTNPLFRMAIEAGLLPDFLQPDGSLLTEASLVKIGPAWLVGVPGELLPRLGLAVKEMLAQAGAKIPGVVGLANDELGYILHAQDFIYPENPFEPGDHYEGTMSVSPEAGPRLMAAIRGVQ